MTGFDGLLLGTGTTSSNKALLYSSTFNVSFNFRIRARRICMKNQIPTDDSITRPTTSTMIPMFMLLMTGEDAELSWEVLADTVDEEAVLDKLVNASVPDGVFKDGAWDVKIDDEGVRAVLAGLAADGGRYSVDPALRDRIPSVAGMAVSDTFRLRRMFRCHPEQRDFWRPANA